MNKLVTRGLDLEGDLSTTHLTQQKLYTNMICDFRFIDYHHHLVMRIISGVGKDMFKHIKIYILSRDVW